MWHVTLSGADMIGRFSDSCYIKEKYKQEIVHLFCSLFENYHWKLCVLIPTNIPPLSLFISVSYPMPTRWWPFLSLSPVCTRPIPRQYESALSQLSPPRILSLANTMKDLPSLSSMSIRALSPDNTKQPCPNSPSASCPLPTLLVRSSPWPYKAWIAIHLSGAPHTYSTSFLKGGGAMI